MEQQTNIWKDFTYYLIRWCFWYGLGGVLIPTTGDGQLLPNVIFGIAFGAVLAVVFTVMQNTVNASRKRWVSWAGVIAILVITKIIVVMATN